jgi:hypothetical protein
MDMNALMRMNPGVDPARLRIGQVCTPPAPAHSHRWLAVQHTCLCLLVYSSGTACTTGHLLCHTRTCAHDARRCHTPPGMLQRVQALHITLPCYSAAGRTR